MIKLIPFAILGAAAVGVTDGAARLLEQQSIGIPAACGIVITVVAAGRWLSGKFESIAIADAAVKTHLKDVELEFKGQLKQLQKTLDNLPCHRENRNDSCPEKEDDTTL